LNPAPMNAVAKTGDIQEILGSAVHPNQNKLKILLAPAWKNCVWS
jgi:hypothetical protein